MTLRTFDEIIRQLRNVPVDSNESTGQIINATNEDYYSVRTYRRTLHRVRDARRQPGDIQLRIGDIVHVRQPYKHVWEISAVLEVNRDQVETFIGHSAGLGISDTSASLSSDEQQIVVHRDEAHLQAKNTRLTMEEDKVSILAKEMRYDHPAYFAALRDGGLLLRPHEGQKGLDSVAVWPKGSPTTIQVQGSIGRAGTPSHRHNYALRVSIPIKTTPLIQVDEASLVDPNRSYIPIQYPRAEPPQSIMMMPQAEAIVCTWDSVPNYDWYEFQYLVGYKVAAEGVALSEPWLYGEPKTEIKASVTDVVLPYIVELLSKGRYDLTSISYLMLEEDIMPDVSDTHITFELNEKAIGYYYFVGRVRAHDESRPVTKWQYRAVLIQEIEERE